VGALSANALLGGLSACLIAKIRGGDPVKAFTVGAFGGSVAYLGKRIAALQMDVSGIVGRAIGSIGAAVVRNAGRGNDPFSELMIPFGPVTLLSRPGAGRGQLLINLRELALIAYGISASELSFDARASLQSGTPVFEAEDRQVYDHGLAANAVSVGGVVFISGVELPDRRATLAHEIIHVIQSDFMDQVWADPVEEWAITRLVGGSRILQGVRPGLVAPGIQGIFDVIGPGGGLVKELREREAGLWFGS